MRSEVDCCFVSPEDMNGESSESEVFGDEYERLQFRTSNAGYSDRPTPCLW